MRPFTVCMLACFLCITAFAQKKPKLFRPFYINFGINIPNGNFGTAPLASNNSKQNILDGYYGAKKPGYLFEFGSKLYFNSSAHKLRFGLDWTFVSANYNDMDWNAYVAAKGGDVTEARVFSLATKLGPVVSYNITGKLVADIHFQAAPVVHYSTFEYSRNTGTSSEDFIFNADKIGDLYGGIKTSAGIGVRWGVIGLGADYFSGKLNTAYQYDNTATGENSNTSGTLKQKVSTSAILVKLSLNL